MTTPAESTAVATRSEDDKFGVGALPDYMQVAIQHRKLLNVVAGEMAKLSWGKELDQPTRRAIADWAHRFNVDPATEIHVLGGNIYPNGRYYLRRLGELVNKGLVEYAFPDHIHRDSRLDTLIAAKDPWAIEEATRRQRERIKHDVREEAVAACVYRIKLVGPMQEITGCKAVYLDKPDPVGKAFPAETVETRAARRAIRMIASHVPEAVAQIIETEEAAKITSESVVAFREASKNDPMMHRRAIAPLAGSGDPSPYGDGVAALPAVDRGDGKRDVSVTVVTERSPSVLDLRRQPPDGAFLPLEEQTEADLDLDRRLAAADAEAEEEGRA